MTIESKVLQPKKIDIAYCMTNKIATKEFRLSKVKLKLHEWTFLECLAKTKQKRNRKIE